MFAEQLIDACLSVLAVGPVLSSEARSADCSLSCFWLQAAAERGACCGFVGLLCWLTHRASVFDIEIIFETSPARRRKRSG